MWDRGAQKRRGKQKKKVKEDLEETTGPGKRGHCHGNHWLRGKGKRFSCPTVWNQLRLTQGNPSCPVVSSSSFPFRKSVVVGILLLWDSSREAD